MRLPAEPRGLPQLHLRERDLLRRERHLRYLRFKHVILERIALRRGLRRLLCGLNPKPKTQNPKPKTQNLKPKTQNPKPKTPNLNPETPNPKPQTLNLKHQTPNHKPSTLDPEL